MMLISVWVWPVASTGGCYDRFQAGDFSNTVPRERRPSVYYVNHYERWKLLHTLFIRHSIMSQFHVELIYNVLSQHRVTRHLSNVYYVDYIFASRIYTRERKLRFRKKIQIFFRRISTFYQKTFTTFFLLVLVCVSPFFLERLRWNGRT